MTFDQLLKIHTICAKAWDNRLEKPGTFDVALGDLKAAIAEVKKDPQLAVKPSCVAMFEWFENIQRLLRDERRLEERERTRKQERNWKRYLKETGGIHIVGGGDCSGNSR